MVVQTGLKLAKKVIRISLSHNNDLQLKYSEKLLFIIIKLIEQVIFFRFPLIKLLRASISFTFLKPCHHSHFYLTLLLFWNPSIKTNIHPSLPHPSSRFLPSSLCSNASSLPPRYLLPSFSNTPLPFSPPLPASDPHLPPLLPPYFCHPPFLIILLGLKWR